MSRTPCANMKTPMEDVLASVLSRTADTVGRSEAVIPKSFLCPQILLCSEKFVLNI